MNIKDDVFESVFIGVLLVATIWLWLPALLVHKLFRRLL